MSSWSTRAEARDAAIKAVSKSKIFPAKMWKFHIHENLGWHASVSIHGVLGFSIKRKQKGRNGKFTQPYSLLIGTGGSGVYGISYYHGNNLDRMIKKAIPQAIEEMKYWTDIVDSLTFLNSNYLT